MEDETPPNVQDSGLHHTVMSWKEQDVLKYNSAEDQSKICTSFCYIISCAETQEGQLNSSNSI